MFTKQNMNVITAMMDWIIKIQKEHKNVYAYGERSIEYIDENGEVVNNTQWLNYMTISHCEPCTWLWDYVLEDAIEGTTIAFYVDDPNDPENILFMGRFNMEADDIYYLVTEIGEEKGN